MRRSRDPSVFLAMMKGQLVVAFALALVATGCGTKLDHGYRALLADVLHHRAPLWCTGQGSNASAVGTCPADDMVARTPLEFVELNDRASAVIDAVATWNAAERASAGMVRMAERGAERVTLESAWLTTSASPRASDANRARARRR